MKKKQKEQPICEIDKHGSKYWKLLNGKYHREDGPAVEFSDRDKIWYINGRYHREDGPAVEWSDGSKRWYTNGKQNKKDGPAVIYNNGDKSWHINGIWIFTIFYDRTFDLNKFRYKKFKNFIFKQIYLLNKEISP